jgi:hypothetical protein
MWNAQADKLNVPMLRIDALPISGLIWRIGLPLTAQRVTNPLQATKEARSRPGLFTQEGHNYWWDLSQ